MRTKETISYNMSRIKCRGTKPERKMSISLGLSGLKGFRKNANDILGKPDFVWDKNKVAVFCDSSFWHGYKKMSTRRHLFKTNRKFWIKKILRNIERDKEVNRLLRKKGWKVLRFWDFKIESEVNKCINKIKEIL